MPPSVAIAGAAVVGAGASIISGNKAAKATAHAADTAAATSQAQYDQTRADYAPYREVGYGALNKLAGLSGVQQTDAAGNPTGDGGYSDGGFTASPGYQFRREQGLQAIDRANSARGVLNSGGADKARMRYADGVAASEYDAYAGRLAQLAGVGQSATGSTAAAGATAAGQIASAQLAGGNAAALAAANTGASINKGVQNLASAYLYSSGGGGGGGAFSTPAPTWSY